MATITVKQFVMLLTSQAITTTASSMTPDRAYGRTPYGCGPIARIVCADGTSLSVQCHEGVHAKFEGVEQSFPGGYASTFGKELIAAEIDCEDLDKYGYDFIEDIEKYVESHGGIDIEATTSRAIEYALKTLEPYKKINRYDNR